MFGNVRLGFGTILENLRKSSILSGRKSSVNHQKRRHQYVYVIKEHYTVARRYEFYVLVARTISHSFAALTREILFLHSNIKFISSRHRVISSIYSSNPQLLQQICKYSMKKVIQQHYNTCIELQCILEGEERGTSR